MSPLPPVYGMPTAYANQSNFASTARSLTLSPASSHIRLAGTDSVRFGLTTPPHTPTRRARVRQFFQKPAGIALLAVTLLASIGGSVAAVVGLEHNSSPQTTKTSQTATATPTHSAADTARFNALFNKNKKDFTPSDIQFIVKYIDGNNVNPNTIYSANIDEVLNSSTVKALDPKGTSDLVQILQKMDWAVRQVSTPGHEAYYTPQDLAAIAHYGDPSCGITKDKADHILQIIKNWHCKGGTSTPTPSPVIPTPTPKPPTPSPTPCPVFNNQSPASYENIIAVLNSVQQPGQTPGVYTEANFIAAQKVMAKDNATGSVMEKFFEKMAYFMGEYNITSVSQSQIKSLGSNQDVMTSSKLTGTPGDNVTDSVDFIPVALGWQTSSQGDLLKYLQEAAQNNTATSFSAGNVIYAGQLAQQAYAADPSLENFTTMTILQKLASFNHGLTSTDLQTLVNQGTPGGISISDADGAPGFLGW